MRSKLGLLAVIPVVAGLVAASTTPAQAYYRGYGGYGYHRGFGGGGLIAGAIVGLGVGSVLSGAFAPRYYAPPVVYAPPPVVYAPPPAYYPPPGYYPAPGYYGR